MKQISSLSRFIPSLRQKGFSLIVSLLMLIVIVILGLGASNMALNEERSARNDRDRQIAFQAAESAVIDAEQELLNNNALFLADPVTNASYSSGQPCGEGSRFRGRTGTNVCFDGLSSEGFVDGSCGTGSNIGLCYQPLSDTIAPIWQTVDFFDTSSNAPSVAYGTYSSRSYPTGGSNQSVRAPRYIIEKVPRNSTNIGEGIGEQGYGEQNKSAIKMYRITAIGFGPNINTQVVLQTIVNTNTD